MEYQQWIPWWLLQQLGLTASDTSEILQYYHHPNNLLHSEDVSALPESLQQKIKALQDQGEQHPLYQSAQELQEKADQQNVDLLGFDHPAYPELLKEIHQPPYLLYVKGDVGVLQNLQLAVVGARKATPLAMQLCRDWCAALAKAGITLTSGLALGIDGCAHQAALDNGGQTIAVVAHGIDLLYPRQHRYLADRICEQGVIVSEFEFSEPAKREYFPQRNRVISGLSVGVLVVEAALKSGTLITARFAMEQGREVFAVPGSVNNVMAKGCHHLIKQGAQLVDQCDDILQALALPLSQHIATKPAPSLSPQAKKILSVMDDVPLHINELQARTGFDLGVLSQELLLLELEGVVVAVNGLYQKLA